MKNYFQLLTIFLILTTALQIRLFHDNKKGYSYNITGSSIEEIIESDQKMRQYLKSLVPTKKAVPAPSVPVPKPAPGKK